MENSIHIIEKPNWISWNDIHNVLWVAHAKNREHGMSMRYASLTSDEIRQRIEGNGKLFCAIKGDIVIGTSAIVKKRAKFWFDLAPTLYAYHCFACVSPEYVGHGVYRQLYDTIERECDKMGLPLIMFDTHENNHRILSINRKNGFKPVDYKFYRDHFNVVMVKWSNGCPYSNLRIKYEFFKRKTIIKLKYWLNSIFYKKIY